MHAGEIQTDTGVELGLTTHRLVVLLQDFSRDLGGVEYMVTKLDMEVAKC